MPLTTKALKAAGFTGFRPIAALDINRIPQRTGIFAILQPEGFDARFLARSTAGIFKKKNPTLSGEALAQEWVTGAEVLFIGKAGAGSKGNRGLRRQVKEFVDFGLGKPPGQWDGRLIWQIADAKSLLVAWVELPPEALNEAQAKYHGAFFDHYGKLPFANLVRAR